MRNRICMAIVTASPCGKIVHREKLNVIKKRIDENKKELELKKRHDEFMAAGSTRELKNFSDNILIQIKLFKQQKVGMAL